MLPSRADVQAWPFLAALFAAVAAVLVAGGAGLLLLDGGRRLLAAAAAWLVLLGGSLLLADLPLFTLLAALEWGLMQWTGKRIAYR